MSDPFSDVFRAMTSQRGDLRLSLHSYEVSKEVASADLPISALIAAAMRKADSGNLALLREAFPQVWADLEARFHARGGVLPAEAR